MLENFKKKPRHTNQKEKIKIYQSNVIKIQVDVMNVKDGEEEEDMEISEKGG